MPNFCFIRSSVAAAAALVGAQVWAQTPPPAPPAPPPPPKLDGQWRGTGGAALSVLSGNASSSSFLVNGDMARFTAADKMSVGGVVNYARANVGGSTVKTAERWNLYGQYDWNLTPKMFAFGRLGLEGDGLIDLSLRVAPAAGVGYKLIEDAATTFTVYGGLAYSMDKYGSSKTIGGRTSDSFNRMSLYLAEESTHKLSDTVSFRQRLDLYPGLSGDKAFLTKFNAGLAVAMSSTMSLNVGVLQTYNSKPPAGVKKNDLALFTGVAVKLGAN